MLQLVKYVSIIYYHIVYRKYKNNTIIAMSKQNMFGRTNYVIPVFVYTIKNQPDVFDEHIVFNFIFFIITVIIIIVILTNIILSAGVLVMSVFRNNKNNNDD